MNPRETGVSLVRFQFTAFCMVGSKLCLLESIFCDLGNVLFTFVLLLLMFTTLFVYYFVPVILCFSDIVKPLSVCIPKRILYFESFKKSIFIFPPHYENSSL